MRTRQPMTTLPGAAGPFRDRGTRPVIGRRRWRMRAAAAAALVVGAAALGGCASVRNELGTANSHCYLSLPKAVAFSGSFHSDQVQSPLGRSTGHLAVVELGYPSKHLFATLLVRHPPLPFGHSHI